MLAIATPPVEIPAQIPVANFDPTQTASGGPGSSAGSGTRFVEGGDPMKALSVLFHRGSGREQGLPPRK